MLQDSRQDLKWTKHSQELIWGLWEEDKHLRARITMLGSEYKLMIYSKYIFAALHGPYLFDELDAAKTKAEEILQEKREDKWRLIR